MMERKWGKPFKIQVKCPECGGSGEVAIDHDALRYELGKEIGKSMQCNCDLDNWEPERSTGHSWVCRIHKAIKAQYKPPKPQACPFCTNGYTTVSIACKPTAGMLVRGGLLGWWVLPKNPDHHAGWLDEVLFGTTPILPSPAQCKGMTAWDVLRSYFDPADGWHCLQLEDGLVWLCEDELTYETYDTAEDGNHITAGRLPAHMRDTQKYGELLQWLAPFDEVQHD